MSAAAKSERLLNLLIMLLVQRHYIAKDRIRSILYPDSTPDGFEKMFERDKEELRSLGVPIEVGQMDAYFDDEPGYRIRPDEFALPDISLAAGRGRGRWPRHQGLAARDARGGHHRGGAQARRGGGGRRRHPAGDRPATAERRRAVVRRLLAGRPGAHPARFRLPEVGPAGTGHPASPALGCSAHSGRWYVVGYDTDRQAERVFRLSRVRRGTPRAGRRAATTSRPTPTSATSPAGSPPNRPTERMRAAGPHRRRAPAATGGRHRRGDVPGPDDATGWDRLVLTRAPPTWPTRCSATARRLRRNTARAARPGRGQAPRRWRDRVNRPDSRAARTRSPACSPWCRCCTPAARCALGAAAEALGVTPPGAERPQGAVHGAGFPAATPRT